LNGHGNPAGNCGVLFVEGSIIANVTMMNPTTTHAVFVGDDNITLEYVSLESALVIQGKDARLNNISAPQLEWWDAEGFGPSSGVMLTPLKPDASRVYDLTPEARWQRALLVDRDGKVLAPGYESESPVNPSDYMNPGIVLPSPAKDMVPLTVRGFVGQIAALQRWEGEARNPLFAILSDGNLASANIEGSAPPGSPNKRLRICDGSGTFIGYIPIYPTS
jgi:hypothetical protein